MRKGKEEEALYNSYFSALGGGDQTSWSRRSWKESRPRQESLRVSSEPSWAARRKSFLSPVSEPRDKASCSSDTLTALGLSCEEGEELRYDILHDHI